MVAEPRRPAGVDRRFHSDVGEAGAEAEAEAGGGPRPGVGHHRPEDTDTEDGLPLAEGHRLEGRLLGGEGDRLPDRAPALPPDRGRGHRARRGDEAPRGPRALQNPRAVLGRQANRVAGCCFVHYYQYMGHRKRWNAPEYHLAPNCKPKNKRKKKKKKKRVHDGPQQCVFDVVYLCNKD